MDFKLNVNVNDHLTRALKVWFEKEEISEEDVQEWLKTAIVDAADDLFVTLYRPGRFTPTGDDAIFVDCEETVCK